MRADRRRVHLALAGVTVALSAAGCAGTKTTSPPPVSPSRTATAATAPVSQSPSAVVPSAAPVTSPAHPSASAPPATAPAPVRSQSSAPSPTPVRTAGRTDRCHTSQLRVREAGGQAAAGTVLRSLDLTDTSAAVCTLYGYPGLQLLDGRRHYLPTTVTRGNSGDQPGPLPLVTMRPGATAHFSYNYKDDFGSDPQQCPVAGYLEVTPPDETDFLLLHEGLAPCRGQIVVGPVNPGAGASY